MVDEHRYEKMLQESLKQELRFLNAQVAGKQKPLAVLIEEETPSIISADGSLQLIKRKELEYLSTLLPSVNWNNLQLPVIIEIRPGEDEIFILSRGEEELTVFSALLGMNLVTKKDRIVIHKAQLAEIRKKLKTTTQYIFAPRTLL